MSCRARKFHTRYALIRTTSAECIFKMLRKQRHQTEWMPSQIRSKVIPCLEDVNGVAVFEKFSGGVTKNFVTPARGARDGASDRNRLDRWSSYVLRQIAPNRDQSMTRMIGLRDTPCTGIQRKPATYLSSRMMHGGYERGSVVCGLFRPPTAERDNPPRVSQIALSASVGGGEPLAFRPVRGNDRGIATT